MIDWQIGPAPKDVDILAIFDDCLDGEIHLVHWDASDGGAWLGYFVEFDGEPTWWARINRPHEDVGKRHAVEPWQPRLRVENKLDLIGNSAFNRLCALIKHHNDDRMSWSGQTIATFPDHEIQQLLDLNLFRLLPYGDMPIWCPGCYRHCQDMEVFSDFGKDYIQTDYVVCHEGPMAGKRIEVDMAWAREWEVDVLAFKRIFGEQSRKGEIKNE